MRSLLDFEDDGISAVDVETLLGGLEGTDPTPARIFTGSDLALELEGVAHQAELSHAEYLRHDPGALPISAEVITTTVRLRALAKKLHHLRDEQATALRYYIFGLQQGILLARSAI